MNRWVALFCGEDTQILQERYPNAFLLLCQIATRARWKDCAITGLRTGEAFIGDWKKAGIPTKKAYEVAKERLKRSGLVGFQGGNKGTRAILMDSRVFSINVERRGKPEDTSTGSKREPKDDLGGTTHTDHSEHTDSQSTQKKHPQDSNSAPAGTAFDETGSEVITAEIAKAEALRLHARDAGKSESLFSTYPPEEIEQWAEQWFLELSATDWMWKGSKVKRPQLLLESYLSQCARGQAKRFNEFRGKRPKPQDEEEDDDFIPF